MRVFLAIPHYFKDTTEEARHGSLRPSAKGARGRALTSAVLSLQELFGNKVFAALHQKKSVCSVPCATAVELRIAICTSGEDHLLNELPCLRNLYEQVNFVGDARFLGFACHKLLEANAGSYDYYGYLEDDIVIDDPLFFVKLELFNQWRRQNGMGDALLQPQRYESAQDCPEVAARGIAHRIYMDYQAAEESPAGLQLQIDFLGIHYTIERTNHPHAGCFFLADDQLRMLVSAPAFGKPAMLWGSPLDAAATLAIANTFKIYKPALGSFSFLQVRHAHPVMLAQLYPSEGPVPAWRW